MLKAASLARASAFSFPSTLECPGTQMMSTLIESGKLKVSSRTKDVIQSIDNDGESMSVFCIFYVENYKR